MRSLLVSVTLLASVSFAQHQKPDLPVQKVDFAETSLTAGRGTPLGEIYAPPPKAKFDCLIQVRMNMNDKLRESVH